ncbi:hypothetical protein [Trujillonella humicola]
MPHLGLPHLHLPHVHLPHAHLPERVVARMRHRSGGRSGSEDSDTPR